MGVSAQHHHFRVPASMSPLQYQKHIRLPAARARLLAGDVDTATAARCATSGAFTRPARRQPSRSARPKTRSDGLRAGRSF